MDHLYLVVRYLCAKYPYKKELSKARLTKMVYLADWRSAIDNKRQLTPINWVFNHFGPYVEDVVDCVKAHPDEFEIELTTNMYGTLKELVVPRPDVKMPDIPASVSSILDFVVDSTSKLYWDDFIKLVYSTYPVVTQPRGSQLDLVALANEYVQQQRSTLGEQ